MTVIRSIITDKRGTVISNKNDNRNRSNDDENSERDEERIVGWGATLRHTLTHSLNPSHFLSLTINLLHIEYNILIHILLLLIQFHRLM